MPLTSEEGRQALRAAYTSFRRDADSEGAPGLLELLGLAQRVNELLQRAALDVSRQATVAEYRPRLWGLLLVLEHLARGVLEDDPSRADSLFPLRIDRDHVIHKSHRGFLGDPTDFVCVECGQRFDRLDDGLGLRCPVR